MFLNPGDMVEGRYRVERDLEGGGYATVYLATNTRLNKTVALKVLRISGPTRDAHAKLLARFEGEAQIAAQLKHRCSVEVSDYGTLPNGQPFLVMEYIDGPTLAEALEAEGAMGAERVKALWLDTLEALAEAHLMGVVHRDLKPDNLMLADVGQRGERLVILDFGIARRVEDSDRKHSTTRGYLGTPSYMPPELLRQASLATAATDVFQVGLIMAEMLTGERRIPADSIPSMVGVYEPSNWTLPDALAHSPFGPLLDRALRLDPDHRFPDASAMLDALDAVDLSPPPTPRGQVPTVVEERLRAADAQAHEAEATRAAETEAWEDASGDAKPTIVAEPEPASQTQEAARSGEAQHTQRPSSTPNADEASARGQVPTVVEEGLRDADAQAHEAEAARAAETEAWEAEPTIIVEHDEEAQTLEARRSGERQHTHNKGWEQTTHSGTQERAAAGQGRQAWAVAGVLAVVCVGLMWALLSRQDAGGGAAVVEVREPERAPSEESGARETPEATEVKRTQPAKATKTKAEDDATREEGGSEGGGEARPKEEREGMVYVEEGYFIRGSEKGDGDEKPEGRVWLDGYWIDRYEVTVGEYAACVKAGKCTVPVKTEADWSYFNWGSSGPRSERLKHPINGVDWDQAVAFCRWKGKRLPTEAEWEKAARGVDGRTYPWGEAKPSCAYAVMDDGEDGCGKDRTWEVGSKPEGVSPYGAHDMAGNVWEWTADWYDEDYYASTDGKGRNPTGPRSGSERVVRGGSWGSVGGGMRASNRFRDAPSGAGAGLGFRCSGSTE